MSFTRGPAVKLLLFLLLFIVCWPAALLAVVLYPALFLLLLPFRILGFAMHGVLKAVAAIFLWPAKLLRAI